MRVFFTVLFYALLCSSRDFGTILQDKRSRFKFESKEKHELLGVIISMCLPVLISWIFTTLVLNQN